MTAFEPAAAPRLRTAHEYAKSMIRDGILGGSLAPGSRLGQSDLAARFGVSTTPVREALRDLTIEGLVQTDPHRGAIVRELDLGEVEEIYELRLLLEPVMIRRTGAALPPGALDEADALHRQMVGEPDLLAWVELNRRFHAVLSSGDDASRLSDVLRSLRNSSAPWVRLSLGTTRVDESHVEHAQLLALYRGGDIEAIVDATVEHLRRTLELIVEITGQTEGVDAPERLR